MRSNSKITIFDIFGEFLSNETMTSSTTKVPMSTTISTTQKPTTTSIPNIFVENNTSEIVEKIDDIENILILIVILLALILIYKLAKLCKRGYRVHNEHIIARHETANARI